MRYSKGRGALSNRDSRFAGTYSEFDQGTQLDTVATEIIAERAKSIISSNRSPDIPFEQSINPYRGCEHGCIYCYARPSHAYMDLSPGLDFETRLFYKDNAVELLRDTISKPTYVCKPIALGSNTDPYQPIEKRYQLTRQLLQLLAEYRHPVMLVTKGVLIERDIDLLADMARHRLVSVMISVTTLDDELKRNMEPRAASPAARLRVIKSLSAAGVPVGALVSPVIPRINDHELEAILAAVHAAGVGSANYMFLRLPLELQQLFDEWLQQHYPERAQTVMSLVRQIRGGKLNDPRFGSRMRGEGVFAQLLQQRFHFACRKLGLSQHPALLDTSAFKLARHGQLNLFA
jgi:DNA repair photolyase